MPPHRLDLQAPQHDLLQPRRIVGPELARRIRIAPKPPPHAAQRFALAERPLAGGEEIQQHAQRKQVAARIVADAEQSLRRHVRRGAVGQTEFFLQQVRQLIVMRQAEIDQRAFAGRAEHDAARLDVVVNDVLPVQIGQRGRDLSADYPRLFIGDRQLVDPAVQRLAGNALHDDVRLAVEIAGAETARHVGAGQPRHDHLLHLEADDGRRVLALGNPRDLHQQRHGDAGMRHRPQRRHAALVDALPDGEAIQFRAGRDCRLRHPLLPYEQAIGQPMWQAVGANPIRRRLDVVRHPAIGDLARGSIEHCKRSRRVAVPRLPDRAEHGEPAPAAEQLHRHV